jgi:hypothetical protein
VKIIVKKLLLTAVFCLCVITSNAFAGIIMFDSAGWVNPSFNDSWNPGTLTGTARYYFEFSNPSVNELWLSLQFEGDVFDIGQLDSGDVNMVNPLFWLDSTSSEPNFKYVEVSGFPINSGNSPIIFDVNYKLLADPSTLNWDEGQVWGQSYAMLGTSGTNLAVSGGSTAPVPEPATMTLLGLGILGLFGLRKKS